MQFKNKITPFLSFESQAEEAAKFYVSLLPGSEILRTVKTPGTNHVVTVEFNLAGLTCVALNTGQPWKFTEAFSLAVACKAQEEIDRLWDSLLEGGEAMACGWLRDKFGVCWQIVPENIGDLIGGKDPEAAKRAFDAMCQMIKLDMHQLQAAYDG